MGCCNSKPTEKKPPVQKPAEKPQKAQQEKKPAAARPPTPKQEKAEQVSRGVEKPVQSTEDIRAARLRAIAEARKSPFHHDRCTVADGEVHALFKEGLVFRIVKGDTWYIYNDSLEYEAHVDYRFGPGSEIVPGERTALETAPDGWISAHAVVYPLETVEYISGTIHGYKSNVTAKPVNKEYLSEMARESLAVAAAELKAVQELAGSEWDEEIILGRCINNGVPYVDVNFPPDARMMARDKEDVREMTTTAMQRPTQYLSGDMRGQSNAITGAVVPQSIDPGNLGDCWVASAASILAEDEEAVKNMCVNTKPEERGVGAYRVALSKHGWWRSVIVDNYLPTISNAPVGAHIAVDPRELWVSLMEKAYAKVHGSYAVITGGDALQMVQDVTGAPTYRFDKEWEAATMNSDKVRGLVQKLTRYIEAGYGVVVSTPSHTSVSYLGCKRDNNPEAFKEKYASVGLRCGYTYVVEKIVSVGDVALFKVHNPWNEKNTWTGAWSAGSAEWQSNPKAESACNTGDKSNPGSFWISWNDAINYFDGGGIIYSTPDAVDYRVKGKFEDVVPTVVLEVEATQAVTVQLVLSQRDKRAGCDDDAGLRFAPCMLSVAQHNGQRHVVEANSSWDPAAPSSEYNFMVARDMALTFTFQPSERPYLVVPRIHRKGVSEGYNRPYSIGIISQGPLDGKLNIRCTTLDAESRVFKNIITFDAGSLPTVEAEHQVHRAGELPISTVGEMVVGTAPVKPVKPVEPAAPSASESDAAISNEDDDDEAAAAHREAVEEPQEVTVTDNAGTPVNVDEAPAEQQARGIDDLCVKVSDANSQDEL